MAIGVNARTAFSLLFPPILDEFGWERGVTAGVFSFGFFVSAMLSPLVGRLMDRRGPRVVIEMGVVVMAAGLMLAPLRAPAVASLRDARRAGRRRRQLPRLHGPVALPPELVRAATRPGARASPSPASAWARSSLLPWLQALIARGRLARRLLGAGPPGRSVVLAPLNLLLKRRPADLGLQPDGDRDVIAGAAVSERLNVVDPAWAAVDWTLARALRTARFWWIAVGYFCGLFAWYAVQVHQTKYLVEIGFSPTHAAWALGLVSLVGRARADRARPSVRTASAANGCGPIGSLGFVLCLPRAARLCATRRRRRCSTSWSSRRACSATASRPVIGAIPGRRSSRAATTGPIFGTLMLAAIVGGAAGPWVTGALTT